MSFEFGDGLTVTVIPPAVPVVITSPPSSSVTVVPLIGPQGAPGPAGAPGGSSYTFTQASPAATWPVTHNLGRYPNVVVRLDSGDRVLADVIDTDTDTLTIVFATPQTGTADLS